MIISSATASLYTAHYIQVQIWCQMTFGLAMANVTITSLNGRHVISADHSSLGLFGKQCNESSLYIVARILHYTHYPANHNKWWQVEVSKWATVMLSLEAVSRLRDASLWRRWGPVMGEVTHQKPGVDFWVFQTFYVFKNLKKLNFTQIMVFMVFYISRFFAISHLFWGKEHL